MFAISGNHSELPVGPKELRSSRERAALGALASDPRRARLANGRDKVSARARWPAPGGNHARKLAHSNGNNLIFVYVCACADASTDACRARRARRARQASRVRRRRRRSNISSAAAGNTITRDDNSTTRSNVQRARRGGSLSVAAAERPVRRVELSALSATPARARASRKARTQKGKSSYRLRPRTHTFRARATRNARAQPAGSIALMEKTHARAHRLLSVGRFRANERSRRRIGRERS